MKNKVILFILLTGISTATFSQAFEKHNVTVGIGVGLGLYGTKLREEYTAKKWNGTNIQNVKIKNDTTDFALSAIYPITIEYGIRNWLGVAARFAYSGYFTELDSLSSAKSKVKGMDADLVLNFHFIKTNKRFDMPISTHFGISTFNITFNDATKTVAKDIGYNYGFSVIPRIYFNKHIGIFFNLGYVGYLYPSLQFADKTTADLNTANGKDWKFSLSGSGANLGFGFIVKI